MPSSGLRVPQMSWMGRDITDSTKTQSMNFRVIFFLKRETNNKHTHVGLSNEKITKNVPSSNNHKHMDMRFHSSKYSTSMFSNPIKHGPRAAAQRKASFLAFTITVKWA